MNFESVREHTYVFNINNISNVMEGRIPLEIRVKNTVLQRIVLNDQGEYYVGDKKVLINRMGNSFQITVPQSYKKTDSPKKVLRKAFKGIPEEYPLKKYNGFVLSGIDRTEEKTGQLSNNDFVLDYIVDIVKFQLFEYLLDNGTPIRK